MKTTFSGPLLQHTSQLSLEVCLPPGGVSAHPTEKSYQFALKWVEKKATKSLTAPSIEVRHCCLAVTPSLDAQLLPDFGDGSDMHSPPIGPDK